MWKANTHKTAKRLLPLMYVLLHLLLKRFRTFGEYDWEFTVLRIMGCGVISHYHGNHQTQNNWPI